MLIVGLFNHFVRHRLYAIIDMYRPVSMALCHVSARGSIFSSKCNYLVAGLHPNPLESLSLPYPLAGFKGWAREGGVWEGREGSMIKGEAEAWRGKKRRRGVGEERRRVEGKWKVERREASLSQQFSNVGAYGARMPGGQCQWPRVGKRRRPWPCVLSASVAPWQYPSNAVLLYVELTSLSYYSIQCILCLC